MSERLVLASDFFNIADKRRQDSADTFRVSPGLRSHAGDVSAFYAVTEASTPGPMGSRARRLVVEVMQSEYASRFDLSPGARLKNAARAAHAELLKEFSGHVRVGVSILVADGHAVYLLQVPPAQAYVLQQGSLHSVTAAQPEKSTAFSFSIGGTDEPYTSLFRDTIEPGDAIVLCGSWVANELEPEDLRAAFALDGPAEITSALLQRSRKLGPRDLTCVALQAQLDEAEKAETDQDHAGVSPSRRASSFHVWDQIDDAVDSLAYVWSCALEELKPIPVQSLASHATDGASTSAVVTAEDPEQPAAIATTWDEPSSPQTTREVPSISIEESDGQDVAGLFRESGTDELPIVPSEPDEGRTIGERGRAGRFHRQSRERARPKQSELDEVNSFLESSLNVGEANPPLQSFPDMTISPERIYPATHPPKVRSRRRIWVRRQGSSRPQPEQDESLPRPAARAPALRRGSPLSSIPRAMWLWSGTGIALVLATVLVAFVFLGGASGINYPLKARTHASAAVRDFRFHSSTAASRQLRAAYSDIRLARERKFSSTVVGSTVRFVQSKANIVHAIIVRHTVRSLTRFRAPNLGLTELAGDGSNIYALDSQGQRIYSYDPSSSSVAPKRIASPGDGFPPLTSPPVVFGMIWHLTAEDNTAVAIDRGYKVIFGNPSTTPTASYQSLVAPSNSANIVGIASYGGNLYLLDASGGQIWKYFDDGLGGFIQSPSPWLTVANPHLLSDADSIAVAHNAIYVAKASGEVLKFVEGRQAPFTSALPVRLLNLSQVFARQDLNTIFLVDGTNGKIVEVDTTGAYIRTIELPHGVISGMHQISVSGDGKTIYFLSGDGLYSTPAA